MAHRPAPLEIQEARTAVISLRRRIASGSVIVAAAVAVVFAGAFGLHRFHDDWLALSEASAALEHQRVWHFLFSPVGRHWSPLWNALELANLKLAGWDSDTAIRSLDIAALAAAAAWFIRIGSRLRLSEPAIALGVGVLALHHANAAPLYSFDTYSQVLADFVTWIAAGMLIATMAGDRKPVRWTSVVTIALLLTVGLLMKEQALSGAASVAWLAALETASPARRGIDRRRLIAIIAIACGLAALFGVLRRTAGLAFETEGPFRLCLACVPVNMTTLAGVIALPVRTVVVADAWRSMQAARLVLIASATAGVIFLLLSGLLRHARATNDRRPILALAGLLAIACFPVAVLGHVGELYAHTAIFWFALLCAIALDGWRRTSPAAARMRPFLTSAIATAYVFSLGLGLRANLTDMRETGVRASAWLARYANRLASLPTGSVVLFRGPVPAKAPAEFSLYRLTTPEQLVSIDALDHVLGHRVGLLLEWDGDERGQLWTSASKNDRAYDLWRRGDALLLQPARSATLARRGALSSR